MTETEDALFASTHAALRFALNYSPTQYERPAMAKMIVSRPNPNDLPPRPGKDLVGLDGAAQAGMIRQEVAQLGNPRSWIIIARYTHHSVPCDCRRSCCGGYVPNKEWQEAIGEITKWVLGAALTGCTSHYHLRRGLVERYFGVKHQFVDLAVKCGVDRDTASQHNDKIKTAIKREDNAAMWAITDRLKLIGIAEG